MPRPMFTIWLGSPLKFPLNKLSLIYARKIGQQKLCFLPHVLAE